MTCWSQLGWSWKIRRIWPTAWTKLPTTWAPSSQSPQEGKCWSRRATTTSATCFFSASSSSLFSGSTSDRALLRHYHKPVFGRLNLVPTLYYNRICNTLDCQCYSNFMFSQYPHQLRFHSDPKPWSSPHLAPHLLPIWKYTKKCVNS